MEQKTNTRQLLTREHAAEHERWEIMMKVENSTHQVEWQVM